MSSTRREFLGSMALAAAMKQVGFASTQNLMHGEPTDEERRSCAPGDEALNVVSRHKAVFTVPPAQIPSPFRMDAPLLGNGNMLAALAGSGEHPQFWLTLNDFWELKNETWLMGLEESVWTPSSNGQGGPRPAGRLVIQVPALVGADYRVEQDFTTATTTATYSKGGLSLNLRSWIAATENLLMIELKPSGGQLDAAVVFYFPDELGDGVHECALLGGLDVHPEQEKGCDDGVLWATRTYKEAVDAPTRAAVGAHFVQPEGVKWQSIIGAPPFGGGLKVEDRGPRLMVQLAAGETKVLAVAMRSWFKDLVPEKAAQSRARWLRPNDLAAVRDLHEGWWRRYWNISFVEVDDPVIEQRYYLCQYMMGSLCRDSDFPPNIFGFATWDRPWWCGDHKIDYNYEMSFPAMLSSGRFDQAPYEAPLLDAMTNAEEMARRLPIDRRGGYGTVPSRDLVVANGHRGVHFAIGLGPKGHLPENGSWGAKNQNAFAMLPIGWRWNQTHDLDYAWRVYPLVRAVADFWEDDLVLSNGVYVIEGDCRAECGGDVATGTNPTDSLSFVRAAMRLALELSAALEIDCSRREKWRDIVDHLSPYPTSTARETSIERKPLATLYAGNKDGDREVFVTERGGFESNDLGDLLNVYPAGQLGLDSDPALLEIARNTAAARILGAKLVQTPAPPHFNDHLNPRRHSNFDCIFFPATVRIGYDPELIWKELRSFILDVGAPNGFRNDNPHGMEKLNLVPNAINEMMLLSHENVLRFFRVWPRDSHPNARFQDLHAYGAFRVSAALKQKQVADIRIVSEKGLDCAVENPWPIKRVAVYRDGRRAESTQGEKFTIKTRAGEVIELRAL